MIARRACGLQNSRRKPGDDTPVGGLATQIQRRHGEEVMRMVGFITRVIAPLMAALGRAAAFLRGSDKTRTANDGFHTTRDGKIRYVPRNLFRHIKRGVRMARYRMGGPKLTGARLARVSKSSCPANLTVQAFKVDENGFRLHRHHAGCTCGQHLFQSPQEREKWRNFFTSGAVIDEVRPYGPDTGLISALQPNEAAH
jgi:hypothetical protein